MDDSLRDHLGIEDNILFEPVEATVAGRSILVLEKYAVGKIIGVTSHVLQVIVFTGMSSDLVRQHSIPPVTTAVFPTATLGNMIEVVRQDFCINVGRSTVHDIAYVLPLAEVESGLFHMSGCNNCFFIRYSLSGGCLVPNITASDCYFSSRPVEPASMRLFHALNHLAGVVKKSLYHQGESSLSSRSFRMYFSSEAFCYLLHKLSAVSVTASASRKQAMTMYYDSLTLEAKSNYITKTSLQIVSKHGLHSLQQMLGIGVGLGLTKRKPTKRLPLVHCMEGSYLTSLELADEIPDELLRKPHVRWMEDSVHLIYTEESRQLSVVIRYSKLIINNKDVVLSRLPTAEVHRRVIGGAYVSSNFHYKGELMTVLQIDGNVAKCRIINDDDDSINSSEWVTVELPLDLVHQLVATFGR